MDEFEKIEYKPISVRTLLIEMKNISELMIDLAYSSALFHNLELAEDVIELEKHVDTLSYLVNMNTMIAARDAKDAEDLLGVTIFASSADKVSDAEAEIASIVLHGIGVHPLVREVFEKVEEHLGRTTVVEKSLLSRKSLRDLELASTIGVDIIAIRRENQWIINPKGSDIIKEKDVLFARGAASGISKLKKLAEGLS